MSDTLLSGVGQIHISATNFERAKAFYKDVLGLPMLFEVPGQSMAFFDCGGVRLYLGKPSDEKYAANSFLYYTVENIDVAYETLTAKGVEFFHPPQAVHKTETTELWMVGFQDTEGNYAQLMCEKSVS